MVKSQVSTASVKTQLQHNGNLVLVRYGLLVSKSLEMATFMLCNPSCAEVQNFAHHSLCIIQLGSFVGKQTPHEMGCIKEN